MNTDMSQFSFLHVLCNMRSVTRARVFAPWLASMCALAERKWGSHVEVGGAGAAREDRHEVVDLQRSFERSFQWPSQRRHRGMAGVAQCTCAMARRTEMDAEASTLMR